MLSISKLQGRWIGRKQGKLTVLEILSTDANSFHWLLCQCDCGKICKRHSSSFKRRIVKSGCDECNKNYCVSLGGIRPSNTKAAFNSAYDSYKRNAKNRNYSFSLSKEEFYVLSQQKCFYCHKLPSNTSKKRNHIFKYNGLDRIDNSKGYVSDNVVPCCFVCNDKKGKMSFRDYLDYLYASSTALFRKTYAPSL